MPRKLRLEYEDAIYHLMSRGDRREDIFLEDGDRRLFLQTLGETCKKTDWRVHAYCLMRNHFHLVVETPKANLCAGMRWFLGTYTTRFNRRHKLFGHLFSGRYKSLVVDGSEGGYLKTVCDYVHLNPVRAKLLAPEQPLKSYPWSSYREYLKRPNQRLGWLRVGRLPGEWRIRQDNPAGRRQFEQGMEERKAQEQRLESEDWKGLRRGWCFGQKSFRSQLLELIGQNQTEHHYGEEVRESAVEKAERLTKQLLEKARWTEADLEKHRKGQEVKVRMAGRLRAETTATWKWIATRLKMGHWRSAANAVAASR